MDPATGDIGVVWLDSLQRMGSLAVAVDDDQLGCLFALAFRPGDHDTCTGSNLASAARRIWTQPLLQSNL